MEALVDIHFVCEVKEEVTSRVVDHARVKTTTRHIRTKCGENLSPEIEGEIKVPMTAFGATVWDRQVTCHGCLSAMPAKVASSSTERTP